jgi:hypothetical protein
MEEKRRKTLLLVSSENVLAEAALQSGLFRLTSVLRVWQFCEAKTTRIFLWVHTSKALPYLYLCSWVASVVAVVLFTGLGTEMQSHSQRLPYLSISMLN